MGQVAELNAYRNRLAGIPANRFIGSILWFSLGGSKEVDLVAGTTSTSAVRVTHAQLVEWFTDLDLDDSFLPPQVKKVDAFRNATSQVSRQYDMAAEGVSATLMIREVTYDSEQVVRHIV